MMLKRGQCVKMVSLHVATKPRYVRQEVAALSWLKVFQNLI